MASQLFKWHAYRIWCPEYAQQHHQLVVCVCTLREWFLYVNSEPPPFRRARENALELASFEAHFLKHVSFVNPVPKTFSDDRVATEIAKDENCLGSLSPTLITKMKNWIEATPVLTADQKAIINGTSPIGAVANTPSSSD